MVQAIDVAGITKRFGRVQALAGVDLQVAPGEVVALLGPNGAGKSTLTRILATIVLPDTGTARICGFDVVNQSADVRRVLGVTLSDERSWYWRLSARRNLEFFATLYGLGRREAARRATELLDELGLTDAADRRFDGFSAGMKARLSLARALLPDPPVLLLDEPTRSLDPVATVSFRTIVRELVGVQGKAVLLTTHNLHEAAELSQHVVVLAGGRVAGTTRSKSTAEQLETMLMSAMSS